MDTVCRKIVITSGKGGVGKTTVTANLGYFLSKCGKRTCLVDADFGLNNLDVITGVENLISYDVIDAANGRCRAKQALVQCPFDKNLYVLPSSHSFKSGVSPDGLKTVIDELFPYFDYILIDCPAGISGGFHTAVSQADEAIVVTTSLLSAIRDADKVISALGGYKLKSVRVLVNMVRGDLVLDKELLSPEEVEGVLRTELIGVIPSDDAVMLSGAGKLPPESEGYKAFKTLSLNVVKNKNKIFDCYRQYSGFWGSLRRSLRKNL